MTLLRLDNVSLAYGHLPLLAHVDFQIEPGERVCLVGRNGTGKSTLLRAITGAALPDDGEIWRQETLRIGHLEQEVPPDTEQTVFEVVAAGLGELGALLTEYHLVTHQAGAAERSSLARLAGLQARIDARDGWNISRKAETVLTRLGLPVDKRLTDCSGGIRRQVMLARALVSEPDLLLLDEPTNHLDVDTLELLEDLLADYAGTLLLVSHDRTFLDNVVTSTLVFEGEGKVGEYVGGYEDWARYRRRLAGERTELPKRAGKPPPAAALEEKRGNRTHKLSYKERRELEALPGKIESLEAEQSRLHTVTSDAEFYKQPGDKIAAAMERLEAVTNELEACYACWESLESDR